MSNKTLNQGDKKIIIKTLINVCCNNCKEKLMMILNLLKIILPCQAH